MGAHDGWAEASPHARSTARAVYHDRHKLTHFEGKHQALFALDADPGERHPLDVQVHAGRVSELSLELEAFVEKARRWRRQEGTGPQVSLDDEAIRHHLRGLGYLG
jgi:hypothetical protein